MTLTSEHHIRFMERALFLASMGLGKSSPHPLAGSVVVKNQQILAEGWYENSISDTLISHLFSSVYNKSELNGCFVFVSTLLDTELLENLGSMHTYKVSGLVVANLIATNLKRSELIKKLQEIGIEVIIGVLSNEEKILNFRFYYAYQHNLPYVILKWAQTADGYIARENYNSKWISNVHSRKIVHKWRAEEDAILVGSNTCRYDNPRLTVRDWEGKNPLRIIIDRYLRLSSNLYVFDKIQPTICYNLVKDHREDKLEFVNLASCIPDGGSFIFAVLSDLFHRGVHSLIVEGGSILLQQFIDEKFWNEARIFQADISFNKGINAPSLPLTVLRKLENYSGNILFLFRNKSEAK